MALSSEDRTEIQLLILQEVGKLFKESSGFSEARRAIDTRRQELEADRLEHQGKHEDANAVRPTDHES